jgi:hypothetical protein
VSIKLSESEKKTIYKDLRPGESIKSLCKRHNVSSHLLYSWINKSKTLEKTSPLQALELIGSEEGYFAKVIIGSKEIWIGQSVPASFINELK